MIKSIAVFALIVQVCTAFVDSMPKVTMYPTPNRQPEPQYGHTAGGLVRPPNTMPSAQPGPPPGPVYQPGSPPPYSLHPGPVHQHGPPSQYSPFPVQQSGQPGFTMGSSSPFAQSFQIPGMPNMMLSIIFGPAPQGFSPFPQQPQPPQIPFVDRSREYASQEDLAKRGIPPRALTVEEHHEQFYKLQHEKLEKEKAEAAQKLAKKEEKPARELSYSEQLQKYYESTQRQKDFISDKETEVYPTYPISLH